MKPLLLVNIFVHFFSFALIPPIEQTRSLFSILDQRVLIFKFLYHIICRTYCIHIPLLGYQLQYHTDFDISFATLAFILQP